jgi:RNA polymerase sigma-70 factor (ECF subfamily)
VAGVSGVETGPARAEYVQTAEERQTVEALRAGDEALFAELVVLYGPAMLRVALMHVSSRAVAEEVVQDAWLGALTGLERFQGRSSFKTWLFSILVNKAKTRAAREGRTVPLSALTGAEDDEEPAVDPTRFLGPGSRWHRYWSSSPIRFDELPEEQLLSEELTGVAEEAIAALPDVQRTVITLRDVEGWSSEEVCDSLELSEGNQRVLLHRARSKVRQALETYLEAS